MQRMLNDPNGAVDVIVPDLPFQRGDEVVVLVSGLGATPELVDREADCMGLTRFGR